jgi:hypothetical protein
MAQAEPRAAALAEALTNVLKSWHKVLADWRDSVAEYAQGAGLQAMAAESLLIARDGLAVFPAGPAAADAEPEAADTKPAVADPLADAFVYLMDAADGMEAAEAALRAASAAFTGRAGRAAIASVTYNDAAARLDTFARAASVADALARRWRAAAVTAAWGSGAVYHHASRPISYIVAEPPVLAAPVERVEARAAAAAAAYFRGRHRGAVATEIYYVPIACAARLQGAPREKWRARLAAAADTALGVAAGTAAGRTAALAPYHVLQAMAYRPLPAEPVEHMVFMPGTKKLLRGEEPARPPPPPDGAGLSAAAAAMAVKVAAAAAQRARDEAVTAAAPLRRLAAIPCVEVPAPYAVTYNPLPLLQRSPLLAAAGVSPETIALMRTITVRLADAAAPPTLADGTPAPRLGPAPERAPLEGALGLRVAGAETVLYNDAYGARQNHGEKLFLWEPFGGPRPRVAAYHAAAEAVVLAAVAAAGWPEDLRRRYEEDAEAAPEFETPAAKIVDALADAFGRALAAAPPADAAAYALLVCAESADLTLGGAELGGDAEAGGCEAGGGDATAGGADENAQKRKAPARVAPVRDYFDAAAATLAFSAASARAARPAALLPSRAAARELRLQAVGAARASAKKLRNAVRLAAKAPAHADGLRFDGGPVQVRAGLLARARALFAAAVDPALHDPAPRTLLEFTTRTRLTTERR